MLKRRYSISGRLVRPMKKLTNPFRWMGCKVAVYDLTSPSESGKKGRKIPSLRRGRNRRGCRSRRGGKKRRALVGAAPETSTPTPSAKRVGSTCWARRARRKVEYSRTLIGVFVDLSRKRNVVKDRLRRCSHSTIFDVDAYTKRMNNLNGLINRTRRSWIELAKTSGDSAEFINIRFRLLVDERSKSFDWTRPFVVNSDWYGELPPPPGQPEWKQRIVRTKKFRLCMHCGEKVTTSVHSCKRENRPVVEKSHDSPESSTSVLKVTERKTGPKKLDCPHCKRQFSFADGHSVKRCALRKSSRK